jgi:RNA polymerase sigma-32 factor
VSPQASDTDLDDDDAPDSASRASILPVPAGGRESALDRPDSLGLYFRELRRYPPLSREEEHALAVRWKDEGDVDAARTLVLRNLRLVVKIAMDYRRAWTNVLDLIQEGNVGLMQAVQRYDPYQGVKLSSYAAYWIRAYILKYLIDNIRLVRIGTTRAQRKLFFRLNREKRELERQGFEAEPRLIAERLDVSEADVREMQQRLADSDLSLDAPLQHGDGTATLGDFQVASGASSESEYADAELRAVFMSKVQAFADSITDAREQRIITARILAEEPKTLQELGTEFGVTRERVRQIEAKLVARLRDYLKQNLVDFEYYGPGGD